MRYVPLVEILLMTSLVLPINTHCLPTDSRTIQSIPSQHKATEEVILIALNQEFSDVLGIYNYCPEVKANADIAASLSNKLNLPVTQFSLDTIAVIIINQASAITINKKMLIEITI